MKTEAFNKIAQNIFENYSIKRDDKIYELLEIEIYMQDDSKKINDIFRHNVDDHLEKNKLYWHYSGFDICIGDKAKNIFCGILVRGIQCKEEIIYGSGKIAYNYKNKKSRYNIEIINKNNNKKFIFSSHAINKNIEIKDLSKIIFTLPRVNLSNRIIRKNLNNKDLDTYLNLKVRYLRIINPEFYIPSNNSPKECREIWNILNKLNIKLHS